MKIDLITLSVISKSLESIAEEMGIILRKSAYSPNIKERLDYSCAIFDKEGELIAQAEHIPVHLGAMYSSLDAVLKKFKLTELTRHDIIILNSPFDGGTHLPDVTFVMPIFIDNNIEFFVVNRAHHADIGGSTPGSMPGISRELFEEGMIIPPVKLYINGIENQPLIDLLLANVRTPDERLGDFRAQRAALLRGEERIIELCDKFTTKTVVISIKELMNLSELAFKKAMTKIPDGSFTFEDYLDSNGIDPNPVKICVEIRKTGENITVSFEGSDTQQPGNCNAPKSVVTSAVFYCFRCITDPSIMTNSGLFRRINIIVPKGSFLDPVHPAAVSSGNVETSQRLTDTVLGALSKVLDTIPAASQGTMNNITIGGKDQNGNPFAYYETLGGGSGASKTSDGVSGIHTNMTNTLNTPIEAFELAYPLRITQYQFRSKSGGKGIHKGGNGLIREIETLVNCSVSIQSERRTFQPYGLHGGEGGGKGKNLLIHPNKEEVIPGRIVRQVKKGTIIRIETPGGGGYGKSD